MESASPPSSPAVLTIGGNDPSGGAGLPADLKTFAAKGVYGMGVLTVATDCTTEGVTDVEALPAPFVRRQLDRVVEDIQPAAVKTGMLYDAAIIETVIEATDRLGLQSFVVDPVMTARRGERLLSDDAETALGKLIGTALVTTPSWPEAERLADMPVTSRDDVERAARHIRSHLGVAHVVVTGGHGSGPSAADCWFDGETVTWLEADRLPYPVHGAGDAYSAAITAGLALGLDVDDAVRRGKAFVTAAIRQAPSRGLGHRPLALEAATSDVATP
jgi:hydroxymethylpyrimidine/phosphomethylpyrimidine kinase